MSSDLQKRIRKLIEDSGLPLDQFGSRVGVSRCTIVNYRDGTTSPTIAFLERLSKEFSINPRWLLLGEGQPYSKDSSPLELGADVGVIVKVITTTLPALQHCMQGLTVLLRSSLPDDFKEKLPAPHYLLTFNDIPNRDRKDGASQLVDEAIEETGVKINQRQKEAITQVIREELTKHSAPKPEKAD